jgi:hypothetical protein
MDKKEKKERKNMDKALLVEMNINPEELKSLKKKLVKAGKKPERGIETWFRLTSKNLYTRLQIVDTKANILITANAIIISVVLGNLYPQLNTDPHMIYAVGGMILTNVLSITFAILATIPKPQSKNNFAGEEVDLMTFDGFQSLSKEEYTTKVMEIMDEGDKLYPSIMTDIHQLGITLSRKYKLIRTSYLIFLYGMIISVAAFGVCHWLF